MIHSFSHRTDGPAFYWEWFLNRLDEGYCRVRNPYYPDKVSTYDLTPDGCDGFTFTSKNYLPVVDGPARKMALASIVDKYPTLWSFTINPYRADIEPRVPSNVDAVACAKTLSSFVGRDRLTWLYSPIAIWDGHYTLEYHIDAFRWLAEQLAPWVACCSFDVLRVYEKTGRNAPMLREPHKWEMDAMLRSFSQTAQREGIVLHACPAHQDFSEFGVDMSPCMSLERFGEINGIEMKKSPKSKGNGLYASCPGGCAAVKDIAPYNTCPAGCLYCYANNVPKEQVLSASVTSDMLLDEVRSLDVVSFAKQRMYRKTS